MIQIDEFKLEKPSNKRKNEAIEYIEEFYQYNSPINGTGGLQRYLEDYEGWLQKLKKDKKIIPNEEEVPRETFFLVRKGDNKIVGMINIRLALNEKMRAIYGNIGYCIRPTERRRGYNKINLYLGLKECQKHGIKEVLVSCDKENLGSAKTIQALDGKLVREFEEKDTLNCVIQKYSIDVDKSIEKFYKKCAFNQKSYDYIGYGTKKEIGLKGE